MNTPAKPRPSKLQPSRYVVGNMWLTIAMLARTATRGASEPLALVLHDDGMLEALAPRHPDYAEKVTSPSFACMISPASDPIRIAARIYSAALRAGAAA